MKKMLSAALLSAMVFVSYASVVNAATVSKGPFTTSAVVQSALDITVVLKKNDFAGATITSMDFGRLIDIGTGTLRSSPTSTTGTGAVDAFISPNNQGLPYTITQTGTAMSNGATTLPAGALTVVPVYAAADNGGQAKPAGATVGTAGSWVGTRTLYTSETGAASARTIQAIYSVTDDPAAGSTGAVLQSQAGGTYTGTVTISITA